MGGFWLGSRCDIWGVFRVFKFYFCDKSGVYAISGETNSFCDISGVLSLINKTNHVYLRLRLSKPVYVLTVRLITMPWHLCRLEVQYFILLYHRRLCSYKSTSISPTFNIHYRKVSQMTESFFLLCQKFITCCAREGSDA